jgi:hypothetical protein
VGQDEFKGLQAVTEALRCLVSIREQKRNKNVSCASKGQEGKKRPLKDHGNNKSNI